MAVNETDPAMVNSLVYDLKPPQPRSMTGYGAMMPTPYRIRYGNSWRRVYVMNYGNAGSAYIRNGNEDLFIDISTEYALSDGLSDERLGL